jgi:hypothetical protein
MTREDQNFISITSSITNPMSTGMGWNFGLRRTRPAINLRSYGTVLKTTFLLSLSVTRQPKSGLAVPLLRFLDHTQSHTHTHTKPVGLLWTSDQHVRGRCLHDKHSTLRSTSSAGFEQATLTIERPQTYDLDRTAIGTGIINLYIKIDFLPRRERCYR